MTLLQLKYFIQAATSGSINKASEVLYISQPGLSSALKELEAELGLELFKRIPKGITLTEDGVEFLGYARQVTEQTSLLEQRYLSRKPSRRLCSISTQHYAFAVNAFVNMVKKTNAAEYEFTLRETRTYEIIEDVKTLRSELGILYLNPFNRKVLEKIFWESGLSFHPLFTAKPHIFVSSTNPLSKKERVDLQDLEGYPCLSFEQGENNSFYFSEEILSAERRRKSVKVTDRATIFNLMIGLDGYTISTGIVSADLNGENIVAVPLAIDDQMEVGWLSHSSIQLTRQAELYLRELKSVISEYGAQVADL
jgi:DNA-binding transcriptional LysR family regulator